MVALTTFVCKKNTENNCVKSGKETKFQEENNKYRSEKYKQVKPWQDILIFFSKLTTINVDGFSTEAKVKV